MFGMQSGKRFWTGLLVWISLAFAAPSLQAEESIEYVAEHLIESSMNARALSYPLIPSETGKFGTAISLAYGSFEGGVLKIEAPMLALNVFAPLSDHWGIVGSFFYDKYRIPNATGDAAGELKLVEHPGLPGSFNVYVTSACGDGNYLGASVALANFAGRRWHWQAGVAIAQMDIKQFDVAFNSLRLSPNFAGVFDYSGRYNINTLFGRLESEPRRLRDSFTFTPHFMLATNLPHVHFQERVIAGGYDFSSSSDSGSHIPDDYIGMGVRFEHIPSHVSIDLGATVYMALFEPVLHKGISSPLFLTVSIPLS